MKFRRTGQLAGLLAGLAVGLAGCGSAATSDVVQTRPGPLPVATPAVLAQLDALAVQPAAPMVGYSRDQFGPAWADVDKNSCDTRDDILKRDLTNITVRADGCAILTGDLADPYTAATIHFVRGGASEVDIDHVVAEADAWRTGAQAWTLTQRTALANDPLNLLAVDAPTNRSKGDADAAEWLPPNKAFRCAYVARQVTVKAHYRLWVTPLEKVAINQVLASCPK